MGSFAWSRQAVVDQWPVLPFPWLTVAVCIVLLLSQESIKCVCLIDVGVILG